MAIFRMAIHPERHRANIRVTGVHLPVMHLRVLQFLATSNVHCISTPALLGDSPWSWSQGCVFGISSQSPCSYSFLIICFGGPVVSTEFWWEQEEMLATDKTCLLVPSSCSQGPQKTQNSSSPCRPLRRQFKIASPVRWDGRGAGAGRLKAVWSS